MLQGNGRDVVKHQGIELKLQKVGKLWRLPEQEAHATMTDIEWHQRYHLPWR